MYKRRRIGIFLILPPLVFALSNKSALYWTQLLSHYVFPYLSCAFFYLPAPFIIASVIALRKKLLSLFLASLYVLSLVWLPFYTIDSKIERKTLVESEIACLIQALSESLPQEKPSETHAPLIPVKAAECISSVFPDRFIGKPPEYAPKGTIMKRLNIAGIFIPLTGQAFISPKEPAFTLPFIACHELSHRLGYADEGDACLIAFVACMRSNDASFRYSGLVHALKYAFICLNEINPESSRALRKHLPRYALSDLEMIGAFTDTPHDTRAFPAFFGNYSCITESLIHYTPDILSIIYPSDSTV